MTIDPEMLSLFPPLPCISCMGESAIVNGGPDVEPAVVGGVGVGVGVGGVGGGGVVVE